MNMEDHDLPIFFESTFGKTKRRFGKIVGIRHRTRCTRSYSIKWADGTHEVYKGAASRPWWIAHIFRNEAAWLDAQEKATQETTK